MTFTCYACKGLLIGQPVDDLAAWLNAETPTGIHFNVVGGLDPEFDDPKDAVVTDAQSGKSVIFIGHSKGAMDTYYIADALNALGLKAPLFIAIDPTDWGSNLPGFSTWVVGMPGIGNAGKWKAPANIGRFINFHQPSYPGGGICIEGGEDIIVPNVDHLTIVNSDTVRTITLDAIGKVLAAAST